MSFEDFMASAPEWLEELVVDAGKDVKKDISSGILSGKMFSRGRRNQDLVSHAGLMRRNGASEEEIEKFLLLLNNGLQDPLDKGEVISIARSMGRYEPSSIEGVNHKSFSDMLLSELKNSCVYCSGDTFYIYHQNVWERDNEGLATLERAVLLTDKLMAQVEQMRPQLEDAVYNNLKKSVKRTQDSPFLMNALKLFKAKKEVRSNFSEFNSEKNYINLQNGVLDIRSFDLKSHSPDYKFTWMLDFKYDANAVCPTFDKFLNDILEPDVQRLLLQILACALFGIDKEQIFVLLHGETQNGKSTLVKAIESMLQPLCANVEPSSLMVKSGDHIPNDLARLAGKRFVFTSETKLGNIMDAPLLKRMTGRDKLTVRFMRAEFFEFVPEFIPFVVTNYLPVIDGSDTALKRRLIIIPFDKMIPASQVDKSLGEKLADEKAGIFNRIVAGLLDYKAEGRLTIPSNVAERVNSYMDGSNLIKRFFDETLEEDSSSVVSARDMHIHYALWAESLRLKPLSEPQFKIIFEQTTRIIQLSNSRHRYWPGLRRRS